MIIIEALIDSTGSIYPKSPVPPDAVLVMGSKEGYKCYFENEQPEADIQSQQTEGLS